MAIRTFLALDLDEPIREKLVQALERLPVGDAKIAWVARRNLHVTLKFLGDVGEGDVAGACQAVAEAARRSEPFDFDVHALRCVPSGSRPRMIWAGVREPTGELAALFERLESALDPLGFRPDERDFQPHITLGRVKLIRDASALRAAERESADAFFGTQHAGEVVVYSSELSPRGPTYAPLAKAPIGG